jgi:hypothetical protein
VESSQQKLGFGVLGKTGKSSPCHFARIADFGCWLQQSQTLKACQEKLKCQTMGIDFSDEGGGKINLPTSK